MRAIENAQQVNRNLTYTKDEVTKDKLKTYDRGAETYRNYYT